MHTHTPWHQNFHRINDFEQRKKIFSCPVNRYDDYLHVYYHQYHVDDHHPSTPYNPFIIYPTWPNKPKKITNQQNNGQVLKADIKISAFER